MNAFQLFKADGSPTKAWFCGKCGYVWSGEAAAQKCCDPRCGDCGCSIKLGKCLCEPCWKTRMAAEKIPWRQYDGGEVFDDDHFLTLGELIDDEDCREGPRPKWVNAAKPFKFELALDGIDLLEQAFERDLGGFTDNEMRGEDLEGAAEFAAAVTAAVTAFNAAQVDGRYHQSDPKRIVVLDDEFWTSYYETAAKEKS